MVAALTSSILAAVAGDNAVWRSSRLDVVAAAELTCIKVFLVVVMNVMIRFGYCLIEICLTNYAVDLEIRFDIFFDFGLLLIILR
jgi:hypothetical protein